MTWEDHITLDITQYAFSRVFHSLIFFTNLLLSILYLLFFYVIQILLIYLKHKETPYLLTLKVDLKNIKKHICRT